MCGIAGFLPAESQSRETLQATVTAMTDTLAHRGPDDDDVWVDPDHGVSLGQRRLAIIDLSPAGRQPMHSSCGRYVAVFNGEIYNFQSLRKELEAAGRAFRGGSDTEVLLEAVAHWGLGQSVKRFIGMFAFALWDRERKELTLVRDRLGIKPLYYGRVGKDFAFGSELKALRAHPNRPSEICSEALTLFFRHNYIPAPYSIYTDVHKLKPGCMLTISLDDPDFTDRETCWWNAETIWTVGGEQPFAGDEEEAVEELDALLRDSVSLRMIADVPLGAFLSGGIDSSTVTGIMQSLSSRPVRTFSIGTHDPDTNEAPYAKAVADHLGTEHTELYVTPKDLLNVVEKIPYFWDEPFSDSSQIPTYCVSRLTRDYVTVSLSGDGGDELFAGYSRYEWIDSMWKRLGRIPAPLRQSAAFFGKALPLSRALLGSSAMKYQWRLDALGTTFFPDFYRYFISHHKRPEAFVLDGHEPDLPIPPFAENSEPSRFRYMQLHDLLHYLPDDILTKVDRASMAVALEARVPILDHRIVEFAARLPHHMKVCNGRGKHLLRRVLAKYVPDRLIDRPKSGFGIPLAGWFRKELKGWCTELIENNALIAEAGLNHATVRRMWREHLDGAVDWSYPLWNAFVYLMWLDSK